MTITTDQQAAHERYERAPATVRGAVDAGFHAVCTEFARRGFHVSANEPAYRLVAEIEIYLEDSAPTYEDLMRSYKKGPS